MILVFHLTVLEDFKVLADFRLSVIHKTKINKIIIILKDLLGKETRVLIMIMILVLEDLVNLVCKETKVVIIIIIMTKMILVFKDLVNKEIKIIISNKMNPILEDSVEILINKIRNKKIYSLMIFLLDLVLVLEIPKIMEEVLVQLEYKEDLFKIV